MKTLALVSACSDMGCVQTATRYRLWMAATVVAASVSLSGFRARAHERSLDVQFPDCIESIGVGLVPLAKARALVPAPFVLVGEGQPVTPLVVSTADCGGISVEGARAKPGSIVQVGAVIVP